MLISYLKAAKGCQMIRQVTTAPLWMDSRRCDPRTMRDGRTMAEVVTVTGAWFNRRSGVTGPAVSLANPGLPVTLRR